MRRLPGSGHWSSLTAACGVTLDRTAEAHAAGRAAANRRRSRKQRSSTPGGRPLRRPRQEERLDARRVPRSSPRSTPYRGTPRRSTTPASGINAAATTGTRRRSSRLRLVVNPKLHHARAQLALYRGTKSDGNKGRRHRRAPAGGRGRRVPHVPALVDPRRSRWSVTARRAGPAAGTTCAKLNLQRASHRRDLHARVEPARALLPPARPEARSAEGRRADVQQLAALVCSQAIKRNPSYAPIQYRGATENAVEPRERRGERVPPGRGARPRFFSAHELRAAVNPASAASASRTGVSARARDPPERLRRPPSALACACGPITGAETNYEDLRRGAGRARRGEEIDPNRADAYYNEGILTGVRRRRAVTSRRRRSRRSRTRRRASTRSSQRRRTSPSMRIAVKRVRGDRASDAGSDTGRLKEIGRRHRLPLRSPLEEDRCKKAHRIQPSPTAELLTKARSGTGRVPGASVASPWPSARYARRRLGQREAVDDFTQDVSPSRSSRRSRTTASTIPAGRVVRARHLPQPSPASAPRCADVGRAPGRSSRLHGCDGGAGACVARKAPRTVSLLTGKAQNVLHGSYFWRTRPGRRDRGEDGVSPANVRIRHRSIVALRQCVESSPKLTWEQGHDERQAPRATRRLRPRRRARRRRGRTRRSSARALAGTAG